MTQGFQMNVLDRSIVVIDDDLRVLESLVNLLSFIWIQCGKLPIRRAISGIRCPFPNELHHHGCRDAENERSRPSAIFEKQQLYRPRNHYYWKAVGTVGGVLSGEWCCRLLQKAG